MSTRDERLRSWAMTRERFEAMERERQRQQEQYEQWYRGLSVRPDATTLRDIRVAMGRQDPDLEMDTGL